MNLTKEEFRKKWVEALRSGEYQQGTGYLCRDGKYCCLGVACDLYAKNEGELNVSEEEVCGELVTLFDDHYGQLPSKVYDALGLQGGNSDKAAAGFRLAMLNDNVRKTFPEIADILETQPDEFFDQE